jgi:hypothetical protein
MANKDFKVKNGLDIQTPLPVSMGGTGQTSTTNTLNSLLPAQGGNANKVLATDGTNTTWVAQALAYQRGGTASRPASPTVGDLYYNTDLNYFEQYTANGWFPIAAAPGIPTGVTATNQGTGRAFNNGQMSVAFTPNSSGGAASSFIVTPSPSTSPSTFTGGTSPITVTGLASSTQYTYTVVATSPYGTSSNSSASSGVTATTVPQAPSLSAVGLDTTATITITPGATGGSAITQYTIISNPVTTTQTTSNTTYTFTGLTNGTAYTFTATATNANGTSAASAASNSVTPTAGNPAYFQIATISPTGSASYTFNNIPQTYDHLQIRVWGKDTRSPVYSSVSMQFNGDTGTNYWYAYPEIDRRAGAPWMYYDAGSNVAQMHQIPGSSDSTNYWGSGVTYIYNYSKTDRHKNVNSVGGYMSTGDGSYEGFAVQSGSQWRNTNAISSIKIMGSGGFNWVSGTKISLYGIKG